MVTSIHVALFRHPDQNIVPYNKPCYRHVYKSLALIFGHEIFELLHIHTTISCNNKPGFILNLETSTFKTRHLFYSNHVNSGEVRTRLSFWSRFPFLSKNIEHFFFFFSFRTDLKPYLHNDPLKAWCTIFYRLFCWTLIIRWKRTQRWNLLRFLGISVWA